MEIYCGIAVSPIQPQTHQNDPPRSRLVKHGRKCAVAQTPARGRQEVCRHPVAPAVDTIEVERVKSKRRRHRRPQCGRGHPCPRKSAPPKAGMPRPTFATRRPEPTVRRWPEHPAPGKSDPELAMPEAGPPQAESSGHIPPIDQAPSGGSGRAARCLPGRALQVKETSADFSMADDCLARDKPYMADP